MSKYKAAVTEMIQKHSEEFEKFSKIHDNFKRDQEKYKSEFDLIGKSVVRIVEETENHLCSKMEGSGKGLYSANLSEKFRQEVRNIYPLIDFVGVQID